MTRSLRTYIAIICAVIFFIVLPMVINREYAHISERMQSEYEADKIAWEVEFKHEISLWAFRENYSITYYTKSATLIDGITDSTTAMLHIPDTAKYIRIVYGNEIRWIVTDI